MTNEVNTKTHEAAPQEMDTWEMATSILVGLRKTMDKVRVEANEAMAKNRKEGRIMGNGYGEKRDLYGALEEAHKLLDIELASVARTSGLKMPR